MKNSSIPWWRVGDDAENILHSVFDMYDGGEFDELFGVPCPTCKVEPLPDEIELTELNGYEDFYNTETGDCILEQLWAHWQKLA